jgi:hypothetical protein
MNCLPWNEPGDIGPLTVSANWSLRIEERCETQRVPPIARRDVHSLVEIFAFLERVTLNWLNVFIEIRLERVMPLPVDNFPRPTSNDALEGTPRSSWSLEPSGACVLSLRTEPSGTPRRRIRQDGTGLE